MKRMEIRALVVVALVWGIVPLVTTDTLHAAADAQTTPPPGEAPLALNWGFESGLADWEKTGTAFDAQPTYGDNVTADRVVANGTSFRMPVGGDYWKKTSFPVGHKGRYWIGTFERRAAEGDPRGRVQGDGPRGVLTSAPFAVSSSYVTFLVGGGRDLERLKVELLEKVAGGPLRYGDGEYRSIPGTARTGAANELLRREWWDVRPHSMKTVRIRIVDEATGAWGHINVDDFTFQAHAPDAVPGGSTVIRDGEVWRDKDAAVWGLADLHTHPLSHLAFGLHVFAGAVDGNTATALGACTCAHGNPAEFQCVGGSDLFRWGLVGGIEGGANANKSVSIGQPLHFAGYNNGNQDFANWPAFYDVAHQEMWWEWLQRAHQGGLRVMVALAHHNQLLARVGNGTPGSQGDDRAALDMQIREIRSFVSRHASWMAIASSPDELRAIVRRGDLAVVLGSEIDNIGNFYLPYGFAASAPYRPQPNANEVRAEIGRLYNSGVRYIFPVHLSDNAFGGTAVYQTDFNQANKFYSRHPWTLETAPFEEGLAFRDEGFGVDAGHLASAAALVARGLSPDLAPLGGNYPNYGTVPGGHRNTRALTPLGREAVREMMRLGMMIDIDHMSSKAVREAFDMAQGSLEHNADDYPLNSGHTGFRRMAFRAHENQRSDAQLEAIRGLGGMMGVGWGCGDVRDFSQVVPLPQVTNSRVPNDAGGSAKTFAQSYLYALERLGGRNVALGTDANSLIVGPAPRFGQFANYCLQPARLPQRSIFNGRQTGQIRYEGAPAPGTLGAPLTISRKGTKSWSLNVHGVAHYGLMPDFLQDLSNVGVEPGDLAPLFLSAEGFARMWERSLLAAGRPR